MRQPPSLSVATLQACLERAYGLSVIELSFLPIGYDLQAFAYQATTQDGRAFFVKVRAGACPPASLRVPVLLAEAGIPHILTPLPTRTQALWCALGPYAVTVYPFIRGTDAMATGLSEAHWREFGRTLQAIHSGGFAPRLQGQVPAETFALPCGALVRRAAARLTAEAGQSPAVRQLVACWQAHTALITHILERAEALGRQLQRRPFECVLCHADIHAANLLVSEDGELYLLDWDAPMLAPRERDLLFVVGSPIARPVMPQEEALFFEGYGPVIIDGTALAYYRYERALEDLGAASQIVLFEAHAPEEDKAVEAALCARLFEAGGIVTAALEADRAQGGPAGPV